jgi:general secretion pathway protein F
MTAMHSTLFEVVAIAPSGAVQSTRVAAQNEQQATQQIQLGGWRVISCRGVPAAARFRRSATARRVRRRWSVHEELAALLDAGLGMVDAINTLAMKERYDSARQAIERIALDLAQGQPLSKALANQSETFPALLIAAASASEQTGDLVPALRRYSAHLETLNALRKVLGAAAIRHCC